MIRLVNSICFYFMTLTLYGCAGIGGGFQPPVHEQMLAKSSICCDSLDKLDYKLLGINKSLRTFVGPNTPVYDFAQGKSYFIAVQIQPKSIDTMLSVRTFPQNMLYNREGHVFVPRIIFLTDDYQILSSLSPEFYVQGPKFGIGESSWRFDLTIPQGAKRAIIHTSDSERVRVMRMKDSDQRSGYLYTRTGPAGEIEISMQ